ncbi:MAG TPA: prepilin-type N-terminal cleavage/methylation domain-containing protein [Candidatus Angelobacter sp.]|nr:prepilin-type N-terminal cleavage/methylation domain-containing protein [Candidatus Angelobacter sp.]
MNRSKNRQRGMSLMEALVALAIAAIVLAAATELIIQGFRVTDLILVRAEMQQDGRAAMNSVLRDLSLSGTGMPVGGIQLPTGNGASASLFGCASAGTCFLKNHLFPGNHMYAVLPDPNDGIVQQGSADAITMVYVDKSLNLGTATSITPSGSQVTVPDVTGVNIGDLIMLSNVHGSAVGMVTNVLAAGNSLLFANSDPLNINQPSAANGNIASLQDPGSGNKYPPTTASRILVISYFLRQNAGPDGLFGTDDDNWQLMRQVNGHQPVPVMDGVENLQFSYDVYDDTADNPSSTLVTNTKGANNTPNLIRKINVVLNVRSPRKTGPAKSFNHLTLAASESPRNLSFRDRYK